MFGLNLTPEGRRVSDGFSATKREVTLVVAIAVLLTTGWSAAWAWFSVKGELNGIRSEVTELKRIVCNSPDVASHNVGTCRAGTPALAVLSGTYQVAR